MATNNPEIPAPAGKETAEKFFDSIFDLPHISEASAGRAGLTLAIILAAIVLWAITWWILRRRIEDPSVRYRARKILSYTLFITVALLLVILLEPFSGRLIVFLGFIGAGIALASQEAITPLFGWYAILSNRLYSIGDRIMIGDVRGEVIDITPTRTKLLELGGDGDMSWISGRQYTGRMVFVSNRMILQQPLYNYSASFEYVWDEFHVVVCHECDWQKARDILEKITKRVLEKHEDDAREGAESVSLYYPVSLVDTGVVTYTEIMRDGIELSSRYLSPLQGTRRIRSQIAERLLLAYAQEKIEFALPAQEIRWKN